MKVVDNLTGKAALSEIGHGKITSQFALFNKELSETITPFVKCKDFLGDVFWGEVTKQNATIYGFKWNIGQDKEAFKEDIYHIVLRKQVNGSNSTIEKATQEEVDNILALLHQFEDSLGFTKSTAELSETGLEIIVSYDKKWTDRPYIYSAFLLLLRIGFKYDGKSDVYEYYKNEKNFLSFNDAGYMRTARETINDLLKGYIDTNQTYQMYNSVGEVHGGSGVVAWTPKYKKPELKYVEVSK